MTLSAEQIQKNWDKHLKIVETFITGERKEQLKTLYTSLMEEMILAPASGKPSYHNAFPGGYIDHVNRVVHCALQTKALWEEMGSVIDFTDEELVFTALHHDLGKLGTKDNLHYIQNDSDWHIKNRGDAFKMNSDNSYMTLTDRTFFTLNHYGITYNEKEYFGIKLTDGMFDEENIKYYKTHDISKSLRYNIQYIMHWADYMSTIIERQNFRNSQ